MNIVYRSLKMDECRRIREMDVSQYIRRAWREVDNRRQLIEIDWLEPDFPNGYENHLANLENTIRSDGIALGAFSESRLVGYCTVNPEFFGDISRYMLLDQLFIDRGFRGKGIGRALFMQAAARARARGADKLYICAGSSEDTVAFYIAIGCQEAAEVNQALYGMDRRDLQMEYDCTGR